jgi:Ser/Thr protein kinase RdoA (MazF antagonist)
MNDSQQEFFALTPERILHAVERLGVRCTGRALALNSMENRVYEVELDTEPTTPGSGRWEHFRVVKFYRPGRWNRDQIEEEHAFLNECREAEIPVVAPLPFPDGTTLAQVPDTEILFAVFPKVGGRIVDELEPAQLRQIGRLLARLHIVGQRSPFRHRIKLSLESYGVANLAFLREQKLLPAAIEGHYTTTAERIFAVSRPWFERCTTQRIHGDCHIGNILWDRDSCTVVDFDDSLEGPCVQDLWLLTPGQDELAQANRAHLLEGYEMMRAFDRDSLRLIEPLRALRLIHFAAWIARRYSDPAFQRVFVDFGSEQYWRSQLSALLEIGESLGVC